ncbi:HAMP domain-containing histidine kinase [Paenibacillus sp. N1-5-1-14]|uniref:sensor histidine kinase n=1 Tax=Paenibacillus radicibacter TaxID=2972488 RepID=UPI0021596B81|nr:HAMP domain-containing sensor histidine kinase [Paenibacillus radicibacter]MCR8642767.1 HAMP domain-containing histidine kinase [Paenibacillus radicibacter]
MIRRRLATRFAWQLVAAGALLTVIAVGIVSWMLTKLTDIEISRQFAPLGISRLISNSTINDQGLIVDPILLARLKEDGGWLQSLDPQGNVLQSFNAPQDLPTHYKPGQLIDYWLRGEPFPYQLLMWIEVKKGHVFTFLYGKKVDTQQLLQIVVDNGKIVDDKLSLSDHVKDELNKLGGFVQVLDQEGVEVASWGKPKEALSAYPLHELALRAIHQERYGLGMETKYIASSGLTWMVQYPMMRSEEQAALKPFIHSEIQVMVVGIAAFLLSSMIVFILLSIWYASQFGTPILLIIGWIQRLGQGNYTDYDQVKNRAIRRKGGWKRKYRDFGEVMESIQSLSVTLQEGKNTVELTQRNREEWIAGVTHDMKTPIASIQGYAHMLEAEKYSWTREEVRHFASKMVEKTNYMDKLINDLALTYRLRSGEIPVQFSQENIGTLLTESVNRVIAHPTYEGRQVYCFIPENPIMAAVYPPWFERIVQNILANGLMHNPVDTRIDIELIQLKNKGWRIDFKDDGQGMDQQTIDRLFERYYRGTSTETVMEGSGLGMAVTKELVHVMGGRIKIETKLGKGTVISIIWDANILKN